MSILIFFIILLVLVISHEFGHFIVAKKSGIRVDEFSFGFKPRLFSKKVGETTYSFNALPFGGYVSIFGQGDTDEEIKEEDKKRSFLYKPWYIKASVLFAGVVMNFLVAWLLLSVGYMSGLPASVSFVPKGATVTNQHLTITGIEKNSPAEKSGLIVGDKILTMSSGNDSLTIDTPENIQTFVRKHDNESIIIDILRDKEEKEISVVPERLGSSNVPAIGISMDVIGNLKLPVHKALWEGLKLSSKIFIGTAVGFYHLISQAIVGKANLSAVTGPVGIVGFVGDAVKFGFVYLLSFTALISLNLAVINLIPFPALDGGQLLFLLIEKIKGSRIKPQIAGIVNTVGFGLLMILMVLVTYHDIVKLIH